MTCGDDITKKIEDIPLSNETIRTCIYNMYNNIRQQAIAAIKTSGQFSLQLNETIYIRDGAELVAYVRYSGLTHTEEEFLFC
jgi:hypothetical protein